jgi:hypothetical protein
MPSAHRRYRDWTHERIRHEAQAVGPDSAVLVDVILRSRPHPEQGSVSACASWRIPVVMGYAPGCFRGMKRDAVPGMSINGGQASV